MFTNSRLHHLQWYKQTLNISQWMESTVVPFQCLFIVRQDTGGSLNPVGEVYNMKSGCLDRAQESSVSADVEQKRRVQVGSESRGKTKGALSVLCYKFSSKLSERASRAGDVFSRHGIDGIQSCVEELRRQEQRSMMQDPGSRIQTVTSRRDKGKATGAIWLPDSPGTPGPARSRTGTVPAKNKKKR